jgi:hypothetical protein
MIDARPDPEVINTELAFPCVWVAPWSRDDGIGPLRGSLVVSAVTGDEDLIDELVAEPSIGNVYSGHYPTWYTAPGIPHDGYLANSSCAARDLRAASAVERSASAFRWIRDAAAARPCAQ